MLRSKWSGEIIELIIYRSDALRPGVRAAIESDCERWTSRESSCEARGEASRKLEMRDDISTCHVT